MASTPCSYPLTISHVILRFLSLFASISLFYINVALSIYYLDTRISVYMALMLVLLLDELSIIALLSRSNHAMRPTHTSSLYTNKFFPHFSFLFMVEVVNLIIWLVIYILVKVRVKEVEDIGLDRRNVILVKTVESYRAAQSYLIVTILYVVPCSALLIGFHDKS